MNITGVRYVDGELCLACDAREGIAASYQIEVGKDYDILPHKEKRSLNANAYAWSLIHKIAAALSKPPGTPVQPIEVYRQAVKNLPDVEATFISISEEAAPAFIESWETGHLGRQVEQFPAEPGFVILRCVYGSSDYDRAEMAMLIDRLVQDAQTLGIETKDPDDVESLLNQWG